MSGGVSDAIDICMTTQTSENRVSLMVKRTGSLPILTANPEMNTCAIFERAGEDDCDLASGLSTQLDRTPYLPYPEGVQ